MRRRGVALLLAAATAGLFAVQPTPGASQSAEGPVLTTLVLFAAAPSGLYRSRDWGGTWKLVERPSLSGDDPQQVGPVQAILPVGPPVYVGGKNGLAVSHDFGETWKRLEFPGQVLSILTSRYHPFADATLFVGTPGGLYRSRDAGMAFDPIDIGGAPVVRMDWPGPALVLATGRGVLRSDDGGSTWRGPGAGLPPGAARGLALSSFFSIDPTLFTSVGAAGIFYSANGGDTWVPKGLPGQTVNDIIWFGPYIYAAADEGLFRSEDAGVTWKPLGTGLAGRSVRQLIFPGAPDSGAEALVATDDGIFRSFDGGHQWARMGLQGEPVTCIATFPPPPRTHPTR